MSDTEEPVRDTTIRAGVTADEHEAIRHFIKKDLGGGTIDEFVREAVRERIERLSGSTLEKLAEAVKARGKITQMELF